jgi:NAD+ synthase
MMTAQPSFSAAALDWLRIDAPRATDQITDGIRHQVHTRLKRKGVVLGISGGIDSSVCAALCVRALGPSRVTGLLMPENDSASESEALGRLLGEALGIDLIREDIGPTLEAAGCYRRRDQAVQTVIPEFQPGDRFKIVLPGLFDGSPYRVHYVVAQLACGKQVRARLPLEAYQTIVAATNFKQRVRKMVEYFHADRLRAAVVGTPNRLEYDQGFFVKNGDGSADLKPIAHLYKTQVYSLAEYLEVPEIIRSRHPTTDTYSLEQSQEEFFFSVPFAALDVCLFAKNHGIPAEEAARAAGLSVAHVERVFQDIDAKRSATAYLHAPPLLIEPVEQAGCHAVHGRRD